MTETAQALSARQFNNIQSAIANHFYPVNVFILNMTPYFEDAGETKVLVDIAIAGMPQLNGVVTVDTNLNVVEQ